MKKRYFHVQNSVLLQDKWNVGDIIETDNSHNRFYKSILNSIGQKKDDYRLLEHARKVVETSDVDIFNPDTNKQRKRIFDLEQLSIELYHSVSQNNKLIREDLFGQIRKAEYNHRPSRKVGIWLTDIEYLQKWYVGFENRPRIYELDIVKEVKVFETNANLIETDDRTIQELTEVAHSYWNADFDLQNLDLKEILFEGKLEVIEEYYSFDEIVHP